MRHAILLLPAFLLLASCGNEDPGPPGPTGDPGTSASTSPSHHGAIVALGSISLAGERFAVARHGLCLSGEEGAFVVSRLGPGEASSLYLWVEDASGEQVSAPAHGDRAGDAWHFHVTPRSDAGRPHHVVLRLREGTRDERSTLPLHPGAAPQHDGVAAPLLDPAGEMAGWLELKLHDDEGDLELWLAEEPAMRQPLDIPLDTLIHATFPHQDHTLTLRPRDTTTNEDEDGKPNIRNSRTNYFVFPTGEAQAPSWLQGADFRSPVTVTVPTPEAHLTTNPFTLVPHTHAPGANHH